MKAQHQAFFGLRESKRGAMSACLVAAVVLIGAALALRLTAQDPEAVSSYDPAVGFHPWDSSGRETPPESWPAWLAGWSSDGQILTNPPMWYVSPDIPAATPACLYFVLDRKVLTNDLSMEVTMLDSFGPPGSPEASLYLDLLATNNAPVATGLYGNLIAGGGNEVIRLQIGIPIATNKAAEIVRLRRGAGEIVVYGVEIRAADVSLAGDAALNMGRTSQIPGDGASSGPTGTEPTTGGTDDSGLAGDAATNAVEVVSTPEGTATNLPGVSTRPPPAIARNIVYVDQVKGDDRLSGVSETVKVREGPKRTIRAGLAVARPGNTLVIKEGGYGENLNVAGRNISVRILGRVNLRNAVLRGGGRNPVVWTSNTVAAAQLATNTAALVR